MPEGRLWWIFYVFCIFVYSEPLQRTLRMNDFSFSQQSLHLYLYSCHFSFSDGPQVTKIHHLGSNDEQGATAPKLVQEPCVALPTSILQRESRNTTSLALARCFRRRHRPRHLM